RRALYASKSLCKHLFLLSFSVCFLVHPDPGHPQRGRELYGHPKGSASVFLIIFFVFFKAVQETTKPVKKDAKHLCFGWTFRQKLAAKSKEQELTAHNQPTTLTRHETDQ